MRNLKSEISPILLLVAVVVVISLLPSAYADLGTFKKDTCVTIRVLSNCSYVNLTEVTTLNKTYIINNRMTRLGGQTFNYSFCNTSDEGIYSYSWFPSCQDCTQVNCGNSFLINGNGKNNQSDMVTLFFILAFLFLIGISVYLGLYTIGHLVTADFDLIDLSIDFGLYFIIIAIYFLQDFYLGNSVISYYLLWFVQIGGLFFIFIPIVAFVLSFIMSYFQNKKLNVEPPRKLRFRR